jgi:hypothetical protein
LFEVNDEFINKEQCEFSQLKKGPEIGTTAEQEGIQSSYVHAGLKMSTNGSVNIVDKMRQEFISEK